jgi:hypothetical protein
MNADLFDTSNDILNGLASKEIYSSSENINESVNDLYMELIQK